MAFEYIKEDELVTTFEDAKKFMLPLFQPLDEFERIARNRPHPGIAKELPKVTDGTLAALIQEQPKRIIQQIPTGKIKADDDWLEIVAGFIFEHEIVPNANQVAALIQKCWALTSKTLTYGSQPVFVQFINRGEYFGTDFTLPYVKDVILEPGKLSDRDSNVIFLRAWYQPNQIAAIIDKEKMLGKNAKGRGDQYETGWDLEALAELKEKGNVTQKDVLSQTPNEKGKQTGSGFIEIVHCFQRGVGAQFYSFSPKTKEVVRRRLNKDPRGAIPIHYMYANVDLSNPLGRGSVEMSGGMQNLLDSEVQSYQYMRALLMNPPLKVRGNISSSMLKYAPNAIWKLGSDSSADVEPAQLETKSLESFPQNYGLIKSQILNLNSSSDTSVSADVGNPGFSKTPQGIQAIEQKLGVSDNYMRKQFESVFEEIAETQINLYFAERSGTQELQLDKETAAKLEKVAPGAVKDGKIRINYDDVTPKLKFEVDASSSNMKDNAEQLEKATNLLELAMKYPQLDRNQGGPIDCVELADRIVSASGLEDPEKVVVKPEPGQEQEQPQVTPQMVMQMVTQAMEQAKEQEKANDPGEHPLIKLMATLNIKFTDLPEDSQHEVLQIIGVPSQMTTPTAQALNLKASDSAVKVAAFQHQVESAETQANQAHANSTMQAAIADAKAKQDQDNLSHQQNVASASDQQARASLQQQADQHKAGLDAQEKQAKVGAGNA